LKKKIELSYNKFIKIFFPRKLEIDTADVEQLRTAFRERYLHFKLLLNANNKALDIMTEMEEALKGTSPFGMTFVRAICTRVSTNVFQIIKHLNDLSPGKYETLYKRFDEIQKNINSPVFSSMDVLKEDRLALPVKEVDKDLVDQVGSKFATLGEIQNRIQIKIPGGFVVTARGYYRFVEHNDLQLEINRRIQATNVARLDQLYSLSADIQQLTIRSSLPEDLAEAISEQYRLLEEERGKRIRIAVRSSALGEDLAGTSFAGQYRSELNVSSENIFQAYKEVVASKYSLPAMTYRLNRGIRDEDVAMCVGCMPMIDAISGGVVYSKNPLNIRDDTIVINSVWGLPKSVVNGSMVPDLFIVTRDDPMVIIKKEIPVKVQKLVCNTDEGVVRLDLTGDIGKMASLTDKQVMELAQLAAKLEKYFGVPQDIEWAIGKDEAIMLLQCRPLQQIDVSKEEGTDADGDYQELVILQGGVTASPGIAAGPVFILKKDMDALQFPEGAVMVAVQSSPRWAALLNRAAAIVTEQGSIAGHLASVAREYNVPAIVGVKGAIDKLSKGRLVTVNADALRIYEGRMDALLKKEAIPENLMEGSPVFEALKGAAQYIIPLNLLNPDAPAFQPKNCRTFHDITRFCHEKSVHEMFQFGKEHHFPERSSKQLVCDIPMQWWVLNLDDGFNDEVEGKYVHLDNIISIPMLALWEGITTFPWEGPPPVDGKGLMSVMFAATRNTALVPGMRSQYANRNYFMISKNYCSLSSRLGFHLSIIETLISDRSGENYISFQFKGGAADDHRRQKRIVFITDLLEEYGFRVEIKEDHLIARVEDREKDFMKKCLKILGYLTIHTRQLDMIMSNNASVNYYRSKIRKDIHHMLHMHNIVNFNSNTSPSH